MPLLLYAKSKNVFNQDMNVIGRRRTESWQRQFAKPGARRAVITKANTSAVQTLAVFPVTVNISAALCSVIIPVAAPKLASLGFILNRFSSDSVDFDVFVLDTTHILNMTFDLNEQRFQRLTLQQPDLRRQLCSPRSLETKIWCCLPPRTAGGRKLLLTTRLSPSLSRGGVERQPALTSYSTILPEIVRNVLYVGDLPYNMEEKILLLIFSHYGLVMVVEV